MAIGLAFFARRAGTGSGAAAKPARIAKALPNALFVGCTQGFNKRLMGLFSAAKGL
jgi:hypothetical protein